MPVTFSSFIGAFNLLEVGLCARFMRMSFVVMTPACPLGRARVAADRFPIGAA